MRESRLSGSEGGVAFNPPSLPLSRQPTPGGRQLCFLLLLARRGCTLRWA
jgi:hypothetical protein